MAKTQKNKPPAVEATAGAVATTTGIGEKAAELFADHPGIDEFHFTTDGTVFFLRVNAINHSKGLENKDVITIKRQEV